MNNSNPYLDKSNRWSSHRRIAEMLEGLLRGARVLDVGCGSGTLARMCAGRGYVLRGIEPNAGWLGEARSLYAELYEASLEDTPEDFLAGHAAVVCGDVLEHLLQPKAQLERLVKAQPENCLFVLSVPNIANIWVRLNLLFGRFDYTDRGILDRTHLHFYTKSTFTQLVEETGLKIQVLMATPIPLDQAAPSFSQTAAGKGTFTLLAGLANIWPSLFGYQWIARAATST